MRKHNPNKEIIIAAIGAIIGISFLTMYVLGLGPFESPTKSEPVQEPTTNCEPSG